MSHKKPVPPQLAGAAPRPRCPVCGMATYSRSGTHPQCMQTSHDRQLRQAIKDAAIPPVSGA